ncbi:hypothetical protein LHP98_11475 [Rhodobacter sp. Har01]|uniref:hypothetical protein n=1 Tax=Rhodobacter sp. Har01 TaxID=2883999 RepID=UPI001D075750|nr:hypothetical protein [Rhodobacter sp. Har01]MCB6178748.1 hypothetical protein [Rhodobacter sp. Har01]
MRILPLIAALAAAGFLAACDDKDDCTPEAAQKKAADLSAKITEVGTTDPAKLAELGPKIQELAAKAQAGGDDLSEACKAMDEMLAELSK